MKPTKNDMDGFIQYMMEDPCMDEAHPSHAWLVSCMDWVMDKYNAENWEEQA